MKICPNCQTKYETGNFCESCGTKLQEEIQELHCPNCGIIVNESSKFCPECGSSLNKEAITEENIYLDEDCIFDADFDFEQCKKEADNGNIAAMYCLARCFKFGENIEKDYDLAFIYFKKCAYAGYEKAYFDLGYDYYYGEGTEENNDEAFIWLKKATEIENPESMSFFFLGDIYKMKHNAEKAFYCYSVAAKDEHNPWAVAVLTQCYLYGYGTTENKDYAFELLNKVCLQEEPIPKAFYLLGEFYKFVWGCKKNIKKAAAWFEKAAEAGHLDASFEWGRMLYFGIIHVPNKTEEEEKECGKSLIEMVAEHGCEQAQRFIDNGYLDDSDDEV
ncbi:MAG: SEL1-like repeat protein [Treponema sp.]|nr:SEL1-like repeat protein [Treponema sp.]